MFRSVFPHNNRAAIGILLLGLIAKRRQAARKKREYIRPIFQSRLVNGEYQLLHELENDPEYHKTYLRMTRQSFEELFGLVEGQITHRLTHAYPIPAKLRLALTLRYVATGLSQRQVAIGFRTSPASASHILREVLKALGESLRDRYLPSPTKESWVRSEKVFREKWNFPFCVGAIDGKHVRIQCPWNSGSNNHNYKGFFSVVVLAVVSGDYRFIVADVGAPGSESDAAIFSNTSFYKSVEAKKLFIPENGELGRNKTSIPYVFVGDEAFPLKPWLMRPFPRQELVLNKKVFNYRLSRARRVVENAFGIWAARWRILFTPINADDDLIHLIITTTIMLHNFLREVSDTEITGDEMGADGSIADGNWRQQVPTGLQSVNRVGSNNYSMQATLVREAFTDYFMNDNRIDGQELYVNRT